MNEEHENVSLFDEQPLPTGRDIGLSARDERAIKVYAREKDLRLSISTPPRIFFLTHTGATVACDLSAILSFYGGWLKEQAKARARIRRSMASSDADETIVLSRTRR